MTIYETSYVYDVSTLERSHANEVGHLENINYIMFIRTLVLFFIVYKRTWIIIPLFNSTQHLIRCVTLTQYYNMCSFSDCRGRSCIVSHVNPGRQGTLAFNSFRSQVAFYMYI